MKTITLISTGLIIASTSFAQTLQDAIKKTENERFDLGAELFRTLIAKEPTKGENYFYFGENYFNNGDLDSANIFYKKGVEVNATYPLNYVGLGKILWIEGKQAEAKTQLYKAATLGGNKNAEVMRKTAEVYIDAEQKNVDEAINLLNAAIKIEPKNPENYILMGDAVLEKNPTDGGPAIKNYNKATELNPKSPKGDLRSGKLYQRGGNYQLALDLYKKAQTTEPNFAPAYREKAELYYKAGQKANAVESYRKYLELNNSAEARYRFASFLFANKQYQEAIPELENLQKEGNTKFYIDRYLGYSYAELGNATDKDAYIKGLKSINTFFDKTSKLPNFKYLASDYKYKGILLVKNGNDSLGILEMEKAIMAEPDKGDEIVRDIAKMYYKSRNYQKSIDSYNRLMKGNPDNLNSSDYFELGRAYYFGPKDFVKADTCFAYVTRLSRTYVTGYFWRGKANIQQDLKNEKWLAKPYFETAMTMLSPEERTSVGYKSNVIEACEYLGFYYASMKENVKAKEYFTILREVDPTNKKQIEFFKSSK